MFRPLAVNIGLRYTRAKRRNHFISFISLASMLGIALGVMVLITVLAVMSGFDDEIRGRVFDVAPQVTVSGVTGKITKWEPLSTFLSQLPGVEAVAPFVDGMGLLSRYGMNRPVYITGIDPKSQTAVSSLDKKIEMGSMGALKAGKYGIVIGKDLADSLGLSLGDKVVLFVPQASITPVGMIPRLRRFSVVGIFHVGKGFGFDDRVGFIHIADAKILFGLGQAVSGLRLKIQDFYGAPQFAGQLASQLPRDYFINTWTDQFGPLFHAIKLEKTMMFLILLLIIMVATFNLVSMLVMVVADKRADIAILRTFGATPGMILSIFIIQGCVVGVVGTLLGVAGGVLLSLNATHLVNLLQDLLHVRLISASIYFVDYLPVKLQISDVLSISGAAFLMSLIATIYPALQAARTQPAEALRYE